MAPPALTGVVDPEWCCTRRAEEEGEVMYCDKSPEEGCPRMKEILDSLVLVFINLTMRRRWELKRDRTDLMMTWELQIS
ncbi:unnamed protein product [Arabis nemorensis]|uniref:Uncharacterized protein n=1 Tax=Arabis nemorensis TaxID=586526 RepID=A0A565CSN8_9BRAS|nr:unnamed protein product [Arabis nemorensis]